MNDSPHGGAVREVQVTVDCADPRALSIFWCAVLGYQFPPPPPGFDNWDAFAETLPPDLRNSASAAVDPTGRGPRLFFQQVPEGKSGKKPPAPRRPRRPRSRRRGADGGARGRE